VGDDTKEWKAPRLRRRVLHGSPQPQWGESPCLSPVIRALASCSLTTSAVHLPVVDCLLSGRLRFLRNEDREAHAACYPRLRYPELYLLAGGYKAFYETHPALCRPRAYRPMLHADHAAELRHFRLKSKTWAGDRKRRQGAPRTVSARRHSLLL